MSLVSEPRDARKDPSRLLFASPVVHVGDFWCAPGHPRFGNTGPTREYCFVFPRTAVWIQHEGSRAFVADSNVVPLYNPGHPYTRRAIARDGDRTDWFGVAPEVLRELLRAHDAPEADAETRLFSFDYARVPAAAFLRQREVFTHVRAAERADAFFVEESAIDVLEAVLTDLYGVRRMRPAGSRHRDLTESVKAAINRSLSGDGGLGELARSVGASVFHLCRVFRACAGTTIHRYRSQLRLRRSLELLDGDGDDILAVAVALGYSSHSHFTDAFHTAFGVAPSQFRNASRRQRARLPANV